MKVRPLRTTVVGSYPFPGWLEFASQHLEQFGKEDLAELIEDATRIAVADQVDAGLDVISDGEQTRLDFNLSFTATWRVFRLSLLPRAALGRRHTISAANTK